MINNENTSELRLCFMGKASDYSITKVCINELYNDKLFNVYQGGTIRYELLMRLVEHIKYTFIDIIGNVKDRYLVCNTTEEERSAYLYPFSCENNDTMESRIADEYVKGNCEINEFFYKIQTEYLKLIDASLEIRKNKQNEMIANKYYIVLGAAHVVDKSMFSEIFMEKHMELVSNKKE